MDYKRAMILSMVLCRPNDSPQPDHLAGFQYSHSDCFVSDNLQGSTKVHSRSGVVN